MDWEWSMDHEIHRIVSFEKVAPFTLRVCFDDGISQVIDFRPVPFGQTSVWILESIRTLSMP
jgi:hypothetical protein